MPSTAFLVHVYAVLAALTSTLILLQLGALAVGLRAYKEPACNGLRNGQGKVAAIVPVYNERPERFAEVLRNLTSVFDRVIVVGDGVDEPYKGISLKAGAEFYSIPKSGKRRALEIGVSKLENEEFVALVDSDTTVPETTVKKAIAVLACGYDAVTVRITVQDSSLLGRLAQMYELYKDLVARSFAGFGTVLVLNGQFSLYRASTLKVVALGLSSRKLFGRTVIIGDDKELTSKLYSLGGKATYLSSVWAVTSGPESVTHFVKQIIRWTRASYLYFFLDVIEMNVQRGAYYFFSGLFSLMVPPLTFLMTLISVGLPKGVVLRFSAPELVFLLRVVERAFLRVTPPHVSQLHGITSGFQTATKFIVHHVDPLLASAFVLVLLTKVLVVVPGFEIVKGIGREVKNDLTAALMAFLLYLAQTYIALYAMLTVFDFTKWLTREKITKP